MNIGISGTVFARKNDFNDFVIVEDRVPLTRVSEHSLSFDMLSMIELYQLHFEVLQCLRKTSVRSTYKMLMEERNKLAAQIQCRIDTANY